jgi:hypothetical protein
MDEMKAPVTDHYFGGCPRCGDSEGYVNVGGNHWFRCDRHKTKWCAGYNLFSGWRDETEEEWQRNADMLAGYETVEPIRPPSVEEPSLPQAEETD